MAIKEREYVCSINNFNEPVVYSKERAIGVLLTRLILLEPGSNPLHPDMGVGIKRYRYTIKTLDKLKKRVEEQIKTYLPCFTSSSVDIELLENHLCNIKITIDDVIYIYDSNEAPIPIRIDDIKSI